MKIYTKAGDRGEASLYNGQQCPKDSAVFAALGDVDELNSVLGIVREHLDSMDPQFWDQLEVIQSRLLDVGSFVATPAESSSDKRVQRASFNAKATEQLESWIDAYDKELPQLTNFILPSGGFTSSHLHLARAVCRRAERSVVALYSSKATEGEAVPTVLPYLNRLSDYLFTVARIAAKRAGQKETVYCKSSD